MTGFRRIGRRFYVKQALRHLRWRTLREKERWPLAISRLRDTLCHTVEYTEKRHEPVADFDIWDTHNWVEYILCHSVEVAQTNNVAEGDIKLQTLRHTKLTHPTPSTLEWHSHNSPCAHPPPHLELHFSHLHCYATFRSHIHSAFFESVKLCRCLTQPTVGSPSTNLTFMTSLTYLMIALQKHIR